MSFLMMPVSRALSAEGGISPVLPARGSQPRIPYFPPPAAFSGERGEIKTIGTPVHPA
jgi:hypothetical protein